MFSNQEQLNKRTPKDGVDRKQFINLLVDEFLNTKSLDAKRQVLGNLANFAYDPINYEHLRQAGALDIFLHQISQQRYTEDQELSHFACTGLCNLCLDPENADHIIKYDGVNLLINLISSEVTETVLSSITTLIFLADRIPRELVTKPDVIRLMLSVQDDSEDKRLKNLATVFLEDVCGKDIVDKYMKDLAAIPLPS